MRRVGRRKDFRKEEIVNLALEGKSQNAGLWKQAGYVLKAWDSNGVI